MPVNSSNPAASYKHSIRWKKCTHLLSDLPHGPWRNISPDMCFTSFVFHCHRI